ncbi:MAG: AAA-associated domain-containing protein [Leptolyngbya sp. BL-A-14]
MYSRLIICCRLLQPIAFLLTHYFSPEEAQRQLDTAVGLGRYAEIFAYDELTGELYDETTDS